MKAMLSFIETVWNIGVLLFSLSYFGGFALLVYKLGESALNLHQTGLISLVALNCSLQGEHLPEQCKRVKRPNPKPGSHR